VKLAAGDLEDLGRGAAFLGTGGGGDPYIGRLMAERAIRTWGEIELIELANLPDDGLVVPVGNMGAPTVLIEKIPGGDEPLRALERLERHLGRRAVAVMPFEAGGVNSMIPLLIAAQRGLPVVDADGMGRAFPELQMETFNIYGVAASPLVVTNEWGDAVLVQARTSRMAEWLARGVTIRMGGQTAIAEYAMDGRTAKRVSIPGTMTLARRLGAALREARAGHDDPFAALAAVLATTPYRHARLLFRGKLTDLRREMKGGFAVGHARIEGLEGHAGTLEIVFQNENLLARHDGRLLAVVPDLICVLGSESGEPITTERLRYGQRVTVIGVSVPEIMRTPEALAVFGPAAFGLEERYVPLERL